MSAAWMLFELPKGYKGDFYEDVKAYPAGALHLCRRSSASWR